MLVRQVLALAQQALGRNGVSTILLQEAVDVNLSGSSGIGSFELD